MKFVLFVEGPTEKLALPSFLKRWLDARLTQHVGIQSVKFGGWPQLIKDSPIKAKLHLIRNDVIVVIALLDLYGPTIYPDNKCTASERYEWAKKELEQRVDHSKFRQFFAVHETEAWLLSDLNIFPAAIKKSLAGKTNKPEDIDFDQLPSKLLGNLFWEKIGRTYKKTTNGKEFFDKLDPNLAYDKCPRLRELLDEMLELAKEAGL